MRLAGLFLPTLRYPCHAHAKGIRGIEDFPSNCARIEMSGLSFSLGSGTKRPPAKPVGIKDLFGADEEDAVEDQGPDAKKQRPIAGHCPSSYILSYDAFMIGYPGPSLG